MRRLTDSEDSSWVRSRVSLLLDGGRYLEDPGLQCTESLSEDIQTRQVSAECSSGDRQQAVACKDGRAEVGSSMLLLCTHACY